MSGAPSRVIGVGASAGGVDALRTLVAELPAGLDAAICVVLHIPANGPSRLADVLDRACALRVTQAVDGEALEPGRVYVAAPDRHLVVRDDRLALVAGPKENGSRPSVDVLLRSLAETHGDRSVGVVLSGALDDGAAGAALVARAGGTVVVQDPQDALVASMPLSAMAATTPDRVLPVAAMGKVLADLVRGPGGERGVTRMQREGSGEATQADRRNGELTSLRCPECGGPLWELRDGGLPRYHCRVGHVYSENTFLSEQGAAVESALWTALEVLEEREQLLREVAGRAGETAPGAAARLCDGADRAHEQADLLRRALRAPAAAEPPAAEVTAA